MKNKKRVCLCLLIIFCCTLFSLTSIANAETKKDDPTVNMINGVMGIVDKAYYGQNGNVELNLLASAGYGTRALFANLGEANKLSVKDFSCEIKFDVAVNISTILSLQTDNTGTVGAGNGNGINILFRNEYEGFFTVAVYDQTANTTFFATELGSFQLNDENTIIFQIMESEGHYSISIKSGESLLTIEKPELDVAFYDTYESHGFKGFISISSYYNAQVENAQAKYSFNKINEKAVVDWEKELIDIELQRYENAVNNLNQNSSAEEIEEAMQTNTLSGEIWSNLIDRIGDEGIRGRITTANQKVSLYSNRLDYEKMLEYISQVKNDINEYNVADNNLTKKAHEDYQKIDFAKLKIIGEPYKSELAEQLNSLKALSNFKIFINFETENFVLEQEQKIVDDDVTDLKSFKNLDNLLEQWNVFVENNDLIAILGEDVVKSYTSRIEKITLIKNDSFYNTLWTEGDSWNAQLIKGQGLLSSGAGLYNETLGFTEKLEVGKNASVTFNVIYALKRLGANHLHIGFYPKTNTGTLGDTDGVRVDFWFSGSTIEVKPVNGRTEEDIFENAYISVPDLGFYDIENPDFDMGQYTVTLGANGNDLFISVNGVEMDIVGLDKNYYKDGCYVTISAISVRGADYNQIMVTNVGDIDYTNYAKSNDTNETNGGCGSCKGNIESLPLSVLAIMIPLFYVVRKKRKENK